VGELGIEVPGIHFCDNENSTLSFRGAVSEHRAPIFDKVVVRGEKHKLERVNHPLEKNLSWFEGGVH